MTTCSSVEVSEYPTSVIFIIYITEKVQRLVDPANVHNRLSQTRWSGTSWQANELIQSAFLVFQVNHPVVLSASCQATKPAFATIVDLPVHILRQSALSALRRRVAGSHFAATLLWQNKQQTWTLIAEPGAGIQQTLQPERPGETTKIMIDLDKPLMISVGIFSFSISQKDLWYSTETVKESPVCKKYYR